MTTQLIATVENGMLKPDTALPFPDQARVKVTIELVEPMNPAWIAWQAFLSKIDERPIIGDGKPYHRDELYERD